jgi:serine/threonine-protein kinase
VVVDSSPDAAAHPPAIPGYDLLEPIGEGGMGIVYRARQHQPPRTVAVKFLMPLPTHQLSLQAFERESRLMAALNHPNVVTIYDCGQIDGRHYLVMEYVSGPSLRQLMEPAKAWPIERAVPVLNAIAGALEYIHQQGILHLDLKPENVLLATGNGERGTGNEEASGVKITDFGVALRRVDARTLSELGLAQGTIDYCSPEQRYGLPIDPRSDLFSLAILAYELLAGHLPGRVFASACARNPLLPAALDDVLRRGLARDPDERYPTVEEFHRDLAAVLTKKEGEKGRKGDGENIPGDNHSDRNCSPSPPVPFSSSSGGGTSS